MKIIVYECKRCNYIYTVINCSLDNCPHCTYQTLEIVKETDRYVLYDNINQMLLE